jgi:hypothetical protein
MHCLSSVYSVTIPLHVSGLLVVHQKVAVYICDSWYVLYVLVDCQLASLGLLVAHQEVIMYICNSWYELYIYTVTF